MLTLVSWPHEEPGKLALEAEPFGSAWRLFCSAHSNGGSGAGAEIVLQLAEPALGAVVV